MGVLIAQCIKVHATKVDNLSSMPHLRPTSWKKKPTPSCFPLKSKYTLKLYYFIHTAKVLAEILTYIFSFLYFFLGTLEGLDK